jgi:hypothetical protein
MFVLPAYSWQRFEPKSGGNLNLIARGLITAAGVCCWDTQDLVAAGRNATAEVTFSPIVAF